MDASFFDRQSPYDSFSNSDDASSMNGASLTKQTTRSEAEPRKRSCELENENERVEKKTKIREKYVLKACNACQGRKVKCSGEEPCAHCRSRGIQCIYAPKPALEEEQRPSARASVKKPRRKPGLARLESGRGPRQGFEELGFKTLLEHLKNLETKVSGMDQSNMKTGNDLMHASDTLGNPRSMQIGQQITQSKASAAQLLQPGLPTNDNPSENSMLLERLKILEARMGEMSRIEQSSGPPTSDRSGNHTAGSPIMAEPQQQDTAMPQPSEVVPQSECPSPKADTFDPYTPDPVSLSLSSQLRQLRERSHSAGALPSARNSQPTTRRTSLRLPSPSELSHLLIVFFRDYDAYFPYMPEARTRSRIQTILKDLGHSDDRLITYACSNNVVLLALLCNMLAIGELLNPESGSQKKIKNGWWLYLQGLRLIRRSTNLPLNLDLVRYHTMCACYLVMTEYITSAAESIFKAYQLAIKLRLNDETGWDTRNQEHNERRKLWWTIYFMDRKISQKAGAPYLVRDNEVMVEDFPSVADQGNETPTWPTPRTASTDEDPGSWKYFQALVLLARLWGRIWDKFFATGTRAAKNHKEIEIMDTCILYFQRTLPKDIEWSSSVRLCDHADPDVEKNIRRRLQIFVRVNLLRMIIRQNPLHENTCDSQTKRFCANVAADTIQAIADFAIMYPETSSSAYFLVSSLTESVYQTVPFLKDELDEEQRAPALSALYSASRLLGNLVGSTKSAPQILGIVDSVITDQHSIATQSSAAGNTDMSQIMPNQHMFTDYRHPRTDASGDVDREVLLDSFGMYTVDDPLHNQSSCFEYDPMESAMFSMGLDLENYLLPNFGRKAFPFDEMNPMLIR